MEIQDPRNGGYNPISGAPFYKLGLTPQFPIQGGNFFTKEYAFELSKNTLGFNPVEIRALQFFREFNAVAVNTIIDFSPNAFYGIYVPSSNGANFGVSLFLRNIFVAQYSGINSSPKADSPLLFDRIEQPAFAGIASVRAIGYLIISP